VEIVVEAPAKLNLFFEVLAKRNDGFHEIETLMCPVDLYDTIRFSEDSSGQIALACDLDSSAQYSASEGDESGCTDIESHGGEVDRLPRGPDNLVWRAADLLRRRAGRELGARLHLTKRVPAEAGLGGGSSDAAATLLAANEGWRLGWSREELMPLAAELGSDVPFFLADGAAVCRGRGEQVEAVEGPEGLHFVIACPPEGLSTAEVYAACRPADEPRQVEPLLRALKEGDAERVGQLLFNRLQGVAETLSPWIERLGSEFAKLDCLGHGMSGSGSSYFALCRHARHARRIAGRLLANVACRAFVVRSCR